MLRFDPSSGGKLKTGARPGLHRADPNQSLSPARSAGAPGAPQPQAPVFKAQSATASRHDRVFKRGSLMFIEGERGEDMYIIKSGKVKVLKQEGSKSIELAVLGPGSVLGEMSLLIDMPRSATAQVVEDVTALSINKAILADTYTKIPPWLVSIIQSVVGRLRDTMKKNSDNLVSDNLGAIVNLLLLLLGDPVVPDEEGRIALPYDRLKEAALYAVGVSGGDTERIVTALILKDLMVITKASSGAEAIEIKRLDVLALYFEYLLARYNGKTLPGDALSDKAITFGRALTAAAREKGVRQKDGSLVVARPVVEIQLERAGLGRFLDLDALDELKNQKLVDLSENVMGTDRMSHKQTVIRVWDKKLERAMLLKEWKAVFDDAE